MDFYKRRVEQLESELEKRDDQISLLKAENDRLKHSDGSYNVARAEKLERKASNLARAARDEYAKVVQGRKEMEACLVKMTEVFKNTLQSSTEDSETLRKIRAVMLSLPDVGPLVEALRDTNKRTSLADRVKNMNGRLGATLKTLSKLSISVQNEAERNLRKAEWRMVGGTQRA